MNNTYYIHGRINIDINLSNSIQSAAGLNDFKPAANGRYVNVRRLGYYNHHINSISTAHFLAVNKKKETAAQLVDNVNRSIAISQHDLQQDRYDLFIRCNTKAKKRTEMAGKD